MLAALLDPTGYSVNLHSVGPWVVGVLIALLGITILLREHGSAVSRAFCALTTSVAIWLLSAGVLSSTVDEPLALWWAKAANFGVVFIPSTVFIFTLTVVQRLREFRALAWGSLAVSCFFYASILATDLFLTGLYRYRWGYYSRYGPLGLPFLVFLLSLLFGSLQLLRTELRRSPDGVTRQRAKALLIALAVGYLAAFDYLGTYGIPVYPFGYAPILGFVVLMTAAVWRYRLREITPSLAAEQIVRTMPDALLVLDRGGVVRVVNQAASQLFRYPDADLIGRPVFATLGDLLSSEKIEALAVNGVMREYESSYRTHGAEVPVFLDITGSAMRDRAGHPIAFVFIIRDISERKHLEEQLHQAQRLEALGHLAGQIGHELDIIFAVGSGHGTLLPTGPDQAGRTHTAAGEVTRAVDRAAELTRQLLSFSSSQRVKPTLLDLNGLVTNLRGIMQWVLGKDIELTTALDPALEWAVADPAQVEQVIIKLAAHAREAMAQGGTLTIETTNVRMAARSPGHVPPGTYARLTVGASRWLMDENTREHLFEPFFMKTRLGRVAGLDLPTVYGIVKQTRGQIDVETDSERGTTFRIYLPAADWGNSGGRSAGSLTQRVPPPKRERAEVG
jgi:PAS domain S-box-containing protein